MTGTMSEEELFLSDESQIEDEPTVETQEQPEEQPTADAAQPPEEQAAAEPVASSDDPPQEAQQTEQPPDVEPTEPVSEHNVPSWRLREQTEAKAAAEAKNIELQQQLMVMQQQLASMQQVPQQQTQQQNPPDLWEDPQGYINHQNQPLHQANNELFLRVNRSEAYAIHGSEAVENALQAATIAERTDPGLTNRILNAPNPFMEMVAWNQQQETQKALGEGGIEGFQQRTKDALMQDPEFRKQVFDSMRAEAGAVVEPKPVETIPSLNGASAAKVNPAVEPSMTEEELFLSS